MKTLLQLEKTYFDMAATSKKDTLVISDRGAMDPSSCMNSFAITMCSAPKIILILLICLNRELDAQGHTRKKLENMIQLRHYCCLIVMD